MGAAMHSVQTAKQSAKATGRGLKAMAEAAAHAAVSYTHLFEQLVGAGNLSAKEKSILDRCTADVRCV